MNELNLSDMGIYAGVLALVCVFLVVMLSLKKQSAKSLQIGLTAGLETQRTPSVEFERGLTLSHLRLL